MPDKPRKYCCHFPCSNLAEPGSGLCKEHRRQAPSIKDKKADQFYLSPEWRRFRAWYISKHPLCEQCLESSFVVEAVIVDHVRELKDGGAPYDEDNAMSLCRACHNMKTAQVKKLRGKHLYTYDNIVQQNVNMASTSDNIVNIKLTGN